MVGDEYEAMHKDFWMEIRKSKARFISIFMIVALELRFSPEYRPRHRICASQVMPIMMKPILWISK